MKTVTLLRIAATVALVQFCAHTTLFLTYAPAHGPDELQVIQTMQSHVFRFSGFLRSYWDMYFGYGLFSAFNCLIEAVLLWLLAGIAKEHARLTQPIVALFLFANVGYTALVWKYFFPLPSYFDIALIVVLGAALIAASRSTNGHMDAGIAEHAAPANITRS
jgi:hypothetical protein